MDFMIKIKNKEIFTMENMEKIEDLLDDSLETLADKKRFAKTMNTIIKDCAKANGIEPKILKAVKDYHHYKGVNWVNGNPLSKDSNKKEKDKVSQVFIKLVEIIDNLKALGDCEFLKPYVDALAEHGIKLDCGFEDSDSTVNTADIMVVIESASKLQTNVDTLSDELKESKSAESEELNFTPKGSFVSVLGIVERIKNGKDVDDTIQNNFTELTMMNNAFTYLSFKNDERKSSE